MNENTDIPFPMWRHLVDQYFEFNYLVTIEDVGTSDSELQKFWIAGQKPLEYVEWFGEKYDLVRHDRWLEAFNP